MRNERILISGAGIAGQTAAYWLARYGFRPTVVEQAARMREGGQGVDIRGRAMEVAERMSIATEVRAAAADVAGMRFVRGDGKEVGRVEIPRTDTSGIEIMRGDLVTLLHEICSDTVEYVFGDTVTALRQETDGVRVEFEHAPPRNFDLVIGADGLHSTIRRLAFGPESGFTRHLGHCFAFGDADSALGPDRWVTLFNTPGRVAGVYRSGTHPGAKAYFLFRAPPDAIDPRDRDSATALLTAEFGRETAWHVPRLLSGVLADPDSYIDTLAQIRMPSWSTGRIALLGDAAHCASPVSGAGAELALTGAYLLAGELAAAEGDHTAAFARYRAAHHPLVRRRGRIGPNLRLMAPRTRLGLGIRDAITRSRALESLAGLERVMAPPTVATLPDYESAAH
ncbi:FAD-dependent monooxygenase [Nocardia bovistercoris]|uniref:FAD-dependent monooxygenase n=1 Tax=Nocardia bovistercoris TaxID=2785916 RepID=A0A931N5H8_9NOCA|nr:FAD-dependent monooxygenase [Nocardia bovistercoris]